MEQFYRYAIPLSAPGLALLSRKNGVTGKFRLDTANQISYNTIVSS